LTSNSNANANRSVNTNHPIDSVLNYLAIELGKINILPLLSGGYAAFGIFAGTGFWNQSTVGDGMLAAVFSIDGSTLAGFGANGQPV
jgi:hypothetical protein